MAAAAAACFSLSGPKPSQKFSSLLSPKNLPHSYRCPNPSLAVKQPQISSPPPLPAVSSPETAVVTEPSGTPPGDDVSQDSASPPPPPPLTGCKACGAEEVERGCNGEGRIQGGIAVVPGFGWWPIKAYRPCPAYVASGGRYRRTGQNMDEVVSGSSAKKSSKKEGVSKKSLKS